MGDRPIVVAHLHWGFPPTIGGVETHMSILLPELVARGFKQWVFTATVEGVEKRMDFQGVEVIHSPVMDLSLVSQPDSGITEGQVANELVEFLNLAKPDIIHAHNLHYFTRMHANVLAGVAKEKGIPLILTAHNVWNENIFLELTAKFPWDHIIAVSHFIKKEITGIGFPNERVTVVHHGIDVEKFQVVKDLEPLYKKYPRLKGKRVIFHPARISLGKGGDVSIKAANIVRKYVDNTILVLAGSGNIIDWDQHMEGDMEFMSELIRILNMQDHVYIDSFSIDQMAELYNLAEVCIYPSTALEPFGLTMLEAQASEKPMVVSRAGGMPEIILDDINGYVVPIRDYETLAHRTIMLMEDKILARRLGKTGRTNVCMHFNKDTMAEATIEVYKETLANYKK
jgi:glycosyltransferase involved in cell wall biosynthesis